MNNTWDLHGCWWIIWKTVPLIRQEAFYIMSGEKVIQHVRLTRGALPPGQHFCQGQQCDGCSPEACISISIQSSTWSCSTAGTFPSRQWVRGTPWTGRLPIAGLMLTLTDVQLPSHARLWNEVPKDGRTCKLHTGRTRADLTRK